MAPGAHTRRGGGKPCLVKRANDLFPEIRLEVVHFDALNDEACPWCGVAGCGIITIDGHCRGHGCPLARRCDAVSLVTHSRSAPVALGTGTVDSSKLALRMCEAHLEELEPGRPEFQPRQPWCPGGSSWATMAVTTIVRVAPLRCAPFDGLLACHMPCA